MHRLLLQVTGICAALSLAACVQTVRVHDVIDLPPPQQVRAARQGNYITVTWNAPAPGKFKPSGYLLYYASHSLATLALSALPPPLAIEPQFSQFSFAIPDSAPVFIHIRTCADQDRVSLPSLPEVVVPAAPDQAKDGC